MLLWNGDIQKQSLAVQKYIDILLTPGHNGLTVLLCGFTICESHSYHGATSDGSVYDPSCREQPYGFLEVKCFYSQRNITPHDACFSQRFFHAIFTSSMGEKSVS